MWDTSEDYRLILAKKSIDYFLNSVKGSKFRGKWNKNEAKKIADNMRSDLQELSYSYMEPEEIKNSEYINNLKSKAEDIKEILGGSEWYKKFLNRAKTDEKSQVEKSIAQIRFFLNTILNLDERFSRGKIDDPIVAVDIKLGEIMSVRDHPNADDLILCNVNVKNKSLSIITNDLNVEESDKVAVSIIPPSQFLGVTSDGMFLGDDEGVLTNVDGEIGELPQDLSLEALKETRSIIEDFIDSD